MAVCARKLLHVARLGGANRARACSEEHSFTLRIYGILHRTVTVAKNSRHQC